jgi:hypothetical protein
MHEREGRFQIHGRDRRVTMDSSDDEVVENLKEWRRQTQAELKDASPRWVRWIGGIFIGTLFAVLMSIMILFIRWMWVKFW